MEFYSTITPISDMLGKKVEFVWGTQQEAAFQTILKEIKSPRLLFKHFDAKKKTAQVIVDPSPVATSTWLGDKCLKSTTRRERILYTCAEFWSLSYSDRRSF